MIIPHHMLSPETLHGVIEAFITREGTEGTAVIVYDQKSESCTMQPGPPGASDCKFTVSYN